MQRLQRNHLLRPWVLSCSLGVFLGIAVAVTTMVLHSRFGGTPQRTDDQFLSLSLMLLAGVSEGALIGFFQWRILRRLFPEMQARTWVGITMLAAVLGWALGMVPPLNIPADSTATPEPALLLTILAGLGTGLVFGALIGLLQNWALQRYLKSQLRWMAANALGWMMGMGIIMAGAAITDSSWPLYLIILTIAGSGALAGLSVGYITGLFLDNMPDA